MQHELVIDKQENLSWITGNNNGLLDSHYKKLRFVDLFSGCGGLSLGIIKAAQLNGCPASCVLAVDSNFAPLEVYKDNIPFEEGSVLATNILDIFKVSSSLDLSKDEFELSRRVGPIDILVAGPPCQGHSDLNNSTRRNDPRNKLYLSCIRAVELLRPQLVIIENVPSVIHSSEGVVQVTEEKLIEHGYKVKHLNINFLDLGLPQTRKRHILIASKDHGFCNSISIASASYQRPTLRDFISDIKKGPGLMYKSGKLSDENLQRLDVLFTNDLYDLPNEYRPPCHRDKRHSYKSVYGRLHWDKPAQTLTSGYGSMGQGRYIHPSEKRTLNSREAARIQGFPDNFSFSRVSKLTDLREMIANAVPPQLTYKLTDLFLKLNSCKKLKS